MIAGLLDLLDEAFDRRSWHGTNLRGSLRGVPLTLAAWRPARGRHNIWELVVHTAYWKYAVRRRLSGERRGGFDRAGSNFWTRPEERSASAWRSDVNLLVRQHRALREVVARFPESRLLTRAPGSPFTQAALIHGIAAHDLYHAGQIQLLKRLGAGRVTDRA
jgi:hypothetical protein